ncbi:MAG: hypothetical protein CFH31_00585 [Alphaproteobacteria bacterium MarineAlpha9_Bin1]|nr:MAG: hypothetical protein CFH31_00585 [Alphaproteobacteria bacterium MarineAlpha9_Bin1]
MKNLFIIRHAKAKSSKQGQEDYDRELNKEGKLRASISGKWINSLSEKIDLICCSSSSRTQQTTKIIANEMKYNPKIIVEPNLYSSDEYDLFHYIKSLDNNKDNLAIVGHEPGLKRLAILLTGTFKPGLEGVLEKKFSSSTIAIITFNISVWSLLSEREGHLSEYFTPQKAI